MRCLLINLDRSADRLQSMGEKFAAVHLPFERLVATDGRAITSEQKSAQDMDRRRAVSLYPLSDSEVACYFSHIRAMENLVASGERMAAVFEDDLDLSPDIALVLDLIEKNIRHFDFIFLHRKFKRGEFFVPCRDLGNGYQVGRVGYAQMGALAYVVSREGAEKFLEFASKRRFGHAVDKEIHRWWANGMEVYGLNKPVVTLSDGVESLIDVGRKEREAFPDARSPKWASVRFLMRMYDSVARRVMFWPYVWRARRSL